MVDNASSDGTVTAVRQTFAGVKVISLAKNQGAVARNVGVAASTTAWVAFADDDSWWQPGSLERAVDILERQPRLGGVVARAVLEPSGQVDAISHKLAAGLLTTAPDLPGPRVLSFPAFCLVVRRSAFEQVGGFSRLLFFGGEEQLLAIDLARAGWPLCYVDEVVARHQPANKELSAGRWALQTRNDILVLWLRRPWRRALKATLDLAVRSLTNRAAARALAGLIWRWPAALRRRQLVEPELEQDLLTSEQPLEQLKNKEVKSA